MKEKGYLTNYLGEKSFKKLYGAILGAFILLQTNLAFFISLWRVIPGASTTEWIMGAEIGLLVTVLGLGVGSNIYMRNKAANNSGGDLNVAKSVGLDS